MTAQTLRPTGFATAWAALCFALVLFLIASITSPQFASGANIRTLLIIASITGIAAVGQTLVVLGGGIDMSVPWLVALGGLEIAHLSQTTSLPVPVLVIGLLGAGAAVGAINAIGVTVLGIAPIIVTLGVGGLIQAWLTEVVASGGANGGTAPGPLIAFVSARLGPLPVPTLLWAAIAVATGVVLHRSSFGRRLYAVGGNRRASDFAGVHSARVLAVTYVVSAVGSVGAGILLAGYVNQAYLGMGLPYLFLPVAAIAIGGTSVAGGVGSYWGTVAGAAVITITAAILPLFNWSSAGLQIGYGVVILTGVLIGRVANTMRERAS